jgi:BirA family biotin operon repressor/biotin-[acetyl-CoA-carboxylase] ligase
MTARRALPDLERAAELVAERGGTLGRPLHVLAETSSTNDEAKHAAKAGAAHGSTWVAEQQTAGRGRQGRTWESTPGEQILASTLLRVTVPPARLPPLALVAGLAVRDAVARAVRPSARVMLKWPNDVLVDGRKVAGILVEATISGGKVEAAIVGFGVNVHTRAFAGELAERATSVALHADTPPDRGVILADVLAGLDRDVEHVLARGLGMVQARLREHDALAGSTIRSEDGMTGVALGIDGEGRLLLRSDADGIVRPLVAGEVHLLRGPASSPST